jgi:hypothetical protein
MRVMPPNKTWMMIIPTPTSSQIATGREDLLAIDGAMRPQS